MSPLNTADVLIIGGGITGASAAYQIALRGYKVILLEKTHLGAGSTGLTGGIIRQHYSNEVTARMAFRSVQVWNDFDNVVGGEIGWVQTGGFFVVGPDDVPSLKAVIALQQGVGIDTQFLDADAIREAAPFMNVADIGGGAYEPGTGYADGAMSTNAYAKRAKDLGAVIRQGIEVTAITKESGRVTGVETTDGRFSAPVVVNAAGPWGARLALGAGFDTPAEVSSHEIAVFHQPENTVIPDPHALIIDFSKAIYLRSETGRLMLAGDIDEAAAQNIVDPDNYSTSVSMDFNIHRAERTEHRIPIMSEARIGKGWAGLYTVTPDWHPIISHMPGLTGFICAYGFSGSGYKMGPVVGEMIADLALAEKKCPIDPHPFRVQRFAENDLIRGQYNYGIIG
jgi:sarcosine oxidase, subunit beta